MTELTDALEMAGLTKTEASVYIFLLQHGASRQADITRGVQLHRRTVYDVLGRLVKKGVVSSVVKNNRHQYEAVKPERIRDIIAEKHAALDAAMPKLNALLAAQTKGEEIRFFKGRHGLKTVFDDQIDEGKPILILGASPHAYKLFKYYFTSFDRRRVERKIKVRIVLDRAAKSKFKRVPLAELRYLPEEIGSVAATNVYGDKVAIILWNELEPFAVVIESKAVADSYRKLFEVVWNKATK